MALQNEELSTKQLLEAQALVFNHAFSFIKSMSLYTALHLGIPDIINNHGKPITLSQLVQSLPIDKSKSQCISRLMRVLTHSKIFVKLDEEEEEKEMRYWLTPISRLLLRDATLTVAPTARLMLDSAFLKPWYHMSEWLASEKHITPFETALGETIWEKLGHEPRLRSLFHDAMASDSMLVTSVLVKDCKHVFQGIKLLADVGGGTGKTAITIADAFRDTKCIVLDLPHVVEGLKDTANVTYVGGDMFENVPQCDAVLLKNILHDWDDEACVKILKKCKEAIPSKDKGGKVIMISMVLDNDKQSDTIIEDQLFSDMIVMTYYNAIERNEREWKNIFTKAGFSNYKITHALGVRSLIEIYPD